MSFTRTDIITKTTIGFLALLLALLIATSARAQEPQTFVGQAAENADLFVAVEVSGDSVIAYVCDGEPGEASTIWGWFAGTRAQAEHGLVSVNGLLISIAFDDAGVSGALVTRDRQVFSFELELGSGDAGIWNLQGVRPTDDVHVFAGWIVLPDGQVRGAMTEDGTNGIVTDIDTLGGRNGCYSGCCGCLPFPESGSVLSGAEDNRNRDRDAN